MSDSKENNITNEILGVKGLIAKSTPWFNLFTV